MELENERGIEHTVMETHKGEGKTEIEYYAQIHDHVTKGMRYQRVIVFCAATDP